jgi:hypothetical protein
MRIIIPADSAGGEDVARQRLVALMLNMEHAATVYGPDLVQLPAPHTPWPLIELKPITRKGLGAFAHYSPTVGVIFYTAGVAFSVGPFVRQVEALLSAHSVTHLKRYRAIAATPSTVMRHKGRISDETQVVGPRKCYRKAHHDRGALPARLLLWTPGSEIDPPPHFSIRAAFTWVFMPVTAVFTPHYALLSAASANAMIASILYDAGRLSSLKEGVDLYRLGLKDFRIRPLPEVLAGLPGQILPMARVSLLGAYGPQNIFDQGALIVHNGSDGGPGGGALTYVGSHESLRASPRPYEHLPFRPWDPERYVGSQCCACSAPVAGDVVLLQAPHTPVAAGVHREWYFCSMPPGSPLLREGHVGKALLLCRFCWNMLESPECLTDHMQAQVLRTTAPHTQVQACEQCPGFEIMALLLGGRVRATKVSGLFVVSIPVAPGESVDIALAAENLGPLPMLTVPEVAALDLPVLANLRLAEARRPECVWPRRVV